jgi:hypothetical protein
MDSQMMLLCQWCVPAGAFVEEYSASESRPKRVMQIQGPKGKVIVADKITGGVNWVSRHGSIAPYLSVVDGQQLQVDAVGLRAAAAKVRAQVVDDQNMQVDVVEMGAQMVVGQDMGMDAAKGLTEAAAETMAQVVDERQMMQLGAAGGISAAAAAAMRAQALVNVRGQVTSHFQEKEKGVISWVKDGRRYFLPADLGV